MLLVGLLMNMLVLLSVGDGGGVITGVTKPLFCCVQMYIVVIVITASTDNDGVCLNYLSRLLYFSHIEY